ncbi:hypothetical protein [Streptomyces sp. NPDC058268]|uniref:hypothetical protein n=1 Tax=Streptomyces sp. NPDC058268 TaxID=3346413 RepID=UPI0036E621B7
MSSHWRRMDATAMGGSLIRWPTHLDSYGGCGTSVYVLWPEDEDVPMIVCSAGLDVHAVVTEEPVGPPCPWRHAFPDLGDPDIEVAQRSACLLGVPLLGTTGGSWALRDPKASADASMHDAFAGFWNAAESDSTRSALRTADVPSC